MEKERTAAFSLPFPSLTFRNAAAHTSSVLAHLRGAPHTASPYAAGGGFAAASLLPPASRAAGRRAPPLFLYIPTKKPPHIKKQFCRS